MARSKGSPTPIADTLPETTETIAEKIAANRAQTGYTRPKVTILSDVSAFPPATRSTPEYVPTPEHKTLTALLEHGGVANEPVVDLPRQKAAYRAAGRRLERTVCFREKDGHLWVKVEDKRTYRPREQKAG